MKKALLSVLGVMLSASVSFAGALSDNDQFQFQDDGGFAGAASGIGAGQVGGAFGFQGGTGFSFADPGDVATEGQTNQQFQNDGVAAADGADFAGSAWATGQNQNSGSAASGGFAQNQQAQGLIGGSAGLTTGGVTGVAGSAGAAGGIGTSFAQDNSVAFAEQDQSYTGVYAQQSTSPNGGFVQQSGAQQFTTDTATISAFDSESLAASGVIQGGGTLVNNDGQGTSMSGAGTAAGEAGAFTVGLGPATAAEANAFGTQTHEYTQFNQSADGTSQQLQTGTVSTTVNASSTF